jgi:hypothetical protein
MQEHPRRSAVICGVATAILWFGLQCAWPQPEKMIGRVAGAVFFAAFMSIVRYLIVENGASCQSTA